jgi:pimeloyl-ACP methyl ester carboxylesterase
MPGWRSLLAAALFAGPLAAQAAPDTGLRSILANGYRFGYVDVGSGMPVVLVHGALTDYRFWHAQLDTPGDGIRMLAYSRRHHHPNPWRPDDQPIGFESSAWDLAAVVRALQLDRPVLVGHSWGAMVVLQAGLRQGGRFRALVLIEPLADSLIDDAPLRAATTARTGTAASEALARYNSRDPVPAMQHWLGALFGPGFWAALDEAGQGRLRDNAHTLPAALAPQPAVTCAELAGLTLPVLLVGGDDSSPRQHATMDTLARCLPMVTRVSVPGAGPLLPRTHPARLAGALGPFLAALPR